MIPKLSGFVLKMLGWKVKGSYPQQQKLIVIVAPHTSNIDFFIGILYLLSIKVQPAILMKAELFFFPLNFLLNRLGGIPVNRKIKTNIREQLIAAFSESKKLTLVITPEGTRKKVTEWKTGFYEIAEKAHVPVFMASLDFKQKVIGLEGYMKLTGNLKNDMKQLKEVYHKSQAKRPENFSVEVDCAE